MFIHVLIITDHKIENVNNKHTVAARSRRGDTNVYIGTSRCEMCRASDSKNINNSDTNKK